MKRRRLRIDRVLLLILALLFIISSLILIIKLLFKKDEKTIIETENIKKVQEIGESASLIEMSDKYAYYLNYPKFNKTNIDKQIQKIINEKIDELKGYANNINNHNTLVKYQAPILYLNYNSYGSFKNISSVFLNYEFLIPFNANSEKGVITLNFNLEKDELLTFDTIFNSDAKDNIANMLTANLKTYSINENEIKNHLNNFIFTDQKLIFFFNPYEIASGNNGFIKIDLDINQIQNHFKQNQEKAIINKETKPKEIIKKTSFPVDSTKPMVALSFDDGPHPAVTSRILDLLEKHQVNATFYMLGINVEGNENLIKRSFAMGNEMGNHSFSHKSLPSLSSEDLYYEVMETNKLINNIINENPASFRPPYGSYNGIVKVIEMPVVLWDVDTEDWRSRDSNEIINIVKNQAKDGSIILMHDIYHSTADSVEEIIVYLKNNGYQLVTVQDLMKYKNIEYKKDQLYFSANNVQ